MAKVGPATTPPKIAMTLIARRHTALDWFRREVWRSPKKWLLAYAALCARSHLCPEERRRHEKRDSFRGGTSPSPHVVRAGYEQIGERYAVHTAKSRTDETYYRRFLDRCLASLPEGGLVLDLGCGAGIVGVEIARRARVVGVDISSTQVRLARHRVPGGSFVLADMARVEFRPAAFDGRV